MTDPLTAGVPDVEIGPLVDCDAALTARGANRCDSRNCVIRSCASGDNQSMREVSVLHYRSDAGLQGPPVPRATAPSAVSPPGRIVLVQTQAENAGAQEITRLLGRGLAARGYEVFNIFFFR